jgi:tetratricopeptide (TPR) repeat protein
MWFVLMLVALAELPPPDYRASLQEAAAAEISKIFEERGIEAAVEAAARWERNIGQDARVAYELGLAWRLSGNEDKALVELNRAIRLDPGMVAACYDRGEIRLNRGELELAEADFEQVVALMPEAWAGHFRLADIAGRKKDPVRFKQELIEALRYGFSFRVVVSDPRWQEYLRDPVLGPELRALLVVYQDESVLRALEQGVP